MQRAKVVLVEIELTGSEWSVKPRPGVDRQWRWVVWGFSREWCDLRLRICLLNAKSGSVAEMKRRFRIVLICLVGLFGILAVMVAVEHVRGRWMLAHWKKAMKLNG